MENRYEWCWLYSVGGTMQKLTEQQLNRLDDMDGPYRLKDIDISHPFVYDRKYGAFYVPFGKHPSAMSQLLAFHHDQRDGIDVGFLLDLDYSSETADAWLRDIPGTAYKSAVNKAKITAGKPGNLSAGELRILGDIEYIF